MKQQIPQLLLLFFCLFFVTQGFSATDAIVYGTFTNNTQSVLTVTITKPTANPAPFPGSSTISCDTSEFDNFSPYSTIQPNGGVTHNDGKVYSGTLCGVWNITVTDATGKSGSITCGVQGEADSSPVGACNNLSGDFAISGDGTQANYPDFTLKVTISDAPQTKKILKK